MTDCCKNEVFAFQKAFWKNQYFWVANLYCEIQNNGKRFSHITPHWSSLTACGLDGKNHLLIRVGQKTRLRQVKLNQKRQEDLQKRTQARQDAAQAKRDAAFALARETGQPAVMTKWFAEDDSVPASGFSDFTLLALPDGTTRIHRKPVW